jgi:hypothetical protein
MYNGRGSRLVEVDVSLERERESDVQSGSVN